MEQSCMGCRPAGSWQSLAKWLVWGACSGGVASREGKRLAGRGMWEECPYGAGPMLGDGQHAAGISAGPWPVAAAVLHMGHTLMHIHCHAFGMWMTCNVGIAAAVFQ
jgi:hypothetical protein